MAEPTWTFEGWEETGRAAPETVATSVPSPAAWMFEGWDEEPAAPEERILRPRPTTAGGIAKQAGLRFLSEGVEGIAESAIQLGQLVPVIKGPLRERFPGGELGLVTQLEDIGMLAEAGMFERIAGGTGRVASFFIPINVGSKILLARNVPKLASIFLPLGLGNYAAARAQAEGEGRDLTRGDYATIAGQAAAGVLIGEAGGRMIGRLLASAPKSIRAPLTFTAQNAALGAAFETGGAVMAREPWDKVGEAAVEGALGSLIGALATHRMPGRTKPVTEAEARELEKHIQGDLEAIAESGAVRQQVETGFTPRLRFQSTTRQGKILEAPTVNRDAWPGWLETWVKENALTESPRDLAVADRVKSLTADGLSPAEIASTLRADGTIELAPGAAANLVLATKAALGVPSIKDKWAFSKWKNKHRERVKAATVEPPSAVETRGAPPPVAGRLGGAPVAVEPAPPVRTPAEELRARLVERGVIAEEPRRGTKETKEAPGAEVSLLRQAEARESTQRIAQATAFVERALKNPRLRELGDITPRELKTMFGVTDDEASSIMRGVLERHQRHPKAGEMLRIPAREVEPSKTKKQKERSRLEREALAARVREMGRQGLEAEIGRALGGVPPGERPVVVRPAIQGRAAARLARHEGKLVRQQAPYLQAEAATRAKEAGLRRAGIEPTPYEPGEVGPPVGARLEVRGPTGVQRPEVQVPSIKAGTPVKTPVEGVAGVRVRAGGKTTPPPPSEPEKPPREAKEPQTTGGTSEGVFATRQAAEEAARAYDRLPEHAAEPPADVISIGPKQFVVVGHGSQDPVARQAARVEKAPTAPAAKPLTTDTDRVATLRARDQEIAARLGGKIPGEERRTLQAERAGIQDELEIIAAQTQLERARAKMAAKHATEETVELETPPEARPAETSPAELDRQLRELRARKATLEKERRAVKGRARSPFIQEIKTINSTIRTVRALIEQGRAERATARARARAMRGGATEEAAAEAARAAGKRRRERQVAAKRESVRLSDMREIAEEVYDKAPEQGFADALEAALTKRGYTMDEYRGRSLYDDIRRELGLEVEMAGAREIATGRTPWSQTEGEGAKASTVTMEEATGERGRRTAEAEEIARFIEKEASGMSQFPETVMGAKWLAENRGGPFVAAYEKILELLPQEPKKMTKRDFAILAGIVSGAALIAKAKQDDVEVEDLGLAALPFLFFRRGVPWSRRRAAQVAAQREAAEIERGLSGMATKLEARVLDVYRAQLGRRQREMPDATRREIEEAVGGVLKEVGGPVVRVRPPGAWAKAVRPVLEVLRNDFGEYGKWMGDRLDVMLRNADSREGAIREEMKLIGVPQKDRWHPAGRTAADPLQGAERENANTIWDIYVRNWLKRKGELPEWKEQEVPKPISNAVRVVVEHAKEYMLGEKPTGDPAVVKAAQAITALKKRWYPAFADEAQELRIMVRLDNGKLVPFQPHLSYAGNYEPHTLRQESVRPTTEGAVTGRKWKQYQDQEVRALKIQDWMIQHLANKYKVSRAAIAQEMSRANEAAKLPYYKYTLDATVKHAGNVELSRYIDTPIGIEIDPAITIPKYVRPAIVRFEYARQFGTAGSLANQMTLKAAKMGYDADAMRKMFDLAAEQTPELIGNHGVDVWLKELTGAASIAGLGTAGIAQLGSVYPILRATAVSANPLDARNWRAFLSGFNAAVEKSLVDLRINKDERAKIRAKLIAETGGTLEGERINWVMQLSGLLPKIATWALHLYGVVPVDRFLRNWASAAGRTYADVLGAEMKRAVAEKDAAALADIKFRIEDLGLGTEGYQGKKINPLEDFARWDKLPPEQQETYRKLVGWTVAYRTQHRTRAADLPFLATHKYAKAFYKFAPFAIRQTQETIRQLSNEVLQKGPVNPHGRFARIVRYAASIAPGVAAGYGIMKLQEFIREPDEEKRREMLSNDPVLQRALSLAAAANLFPWIADWVEASTYPGGLGRRLAGPVYGQVTEFSQYALPAATRGDPGPALRYLVKAFGIPGISGARGTPLGRILGVPSGKELIESGALRETPVVGKFLVPTPPGKPSFGSAYLRREAPAVAEFLAGPPRSGLKRRRLYE